MLVDTCIKQEKRRGNGGFPCQDRTNTAYNHHNHLRRSGSIQRRLSAAGAIKRLTHITGATDKHYSLGSASMACVEQSKDWVDYLVSLTPICVAIFAGYIGLRQARISRDKLRLDLYNRRFEIYEITLSFYQSIINYAPSDDEAFRPVHRSFIKAMKESQFLFDPQSGIYKILQKMHEDSFKVTGFKKIGPELSAADPIAFSKMHTEMQDVLTSFAFRIESIEKAIAPYLNFHKVVV